jgi:hypothetical protein
MLLIGLLCLGSCGGVLALGALVGAVVCGRGRRPLLAVLLAVSAAGLGLAALTCLVTGVLVITEWETVTGGAPPVVATVVVKPPIVVTVVVVPRTVVETPVPTETDVETGPSAEEILGLSADVMSGVTSAHMVFAQEAVGSYTASGDGVVVLPDRAHVMRTSSLDQAPVETIIGSTGYWVDESVSGGWNSGPVAPFASNPARWVELLWFQDRPVLVGEETVNGVDCYHLEFDVNLEPGWLGLFNGGGTGEAWVSAEDFSLVKATYDLQYEGARESGRMKLSLELSAFDEPVAIEAPR